MRRARRNAVRLSLVVVWLFALSGLPPAGAATTPSLRLFAAASTITAERGARDRVVVDPGVWIASVGGPFELRASRPDYDTPVSLAQTDAGTGAVLRDLSPELLDGWAGLKDFVHIAIRDLDGKLALRSPMSFCPNSWSRSRVNDEGPLISRYPYFCGGNPFTKGTVYGIDAGWAVPTLPDYYSYGAFVFRADQRRYDIKMWIDPAWQAALEIPAEQATTTVRLRVVPRGSDHGGGTPPMPASLSEPLAGVPDTTAPPPAGTPDLIALPAWGINVYSRRGRDFLAFNATEWNAGPGTLLVEGFREPDQALMDAYQYFLVDGRPVARAPVGNLEFHREHQHWHFQQFTEYSLLDASSGRIALSDKQSWCLANTDALDLSVPNANWGAYGGDVFTMCGGPGAIWIREVLDVGWGDTYGQYIPGQAFDITNLPNGNYYIRVHVNPVGLLHESRTDNNVEDRLVKLRGRPGARRIVVPPWHGIDTENYCPYCA
jgi:hypothetical protein